MYDQQKLQGLPIITLRVCPFESLFPCHFSTIFFNNTTYAFLGSVIIRKTLQILVTTRKRNLGQGNIFTPVILSTGGGGGRYTPRDQVHPPPSSACWEIRATSGRYASYWNAFLFPFLSSVYS